MIPPSVETPVADKLTETEGHPVAEDIAPEPPLGVPEHGKAHAIAKSKPGRVEEPSEVNLIVNAPVE